MASVAGSPEPSEPLPVALVQPNGLPATLPQSSASRAAAEISDEILYIGVGGAVEEELARRAGIPFRAIESGQVRGMAPWVAARNLLKAAKGSRQARSLMAEFRPDVVFVTGGFVAGPVVLAASRVGLPVFIYLPDVEPGLAIQRMSRFARKVGVTFPEVARYFPGKAVVTGYPVRSDILSLAGQKAMARQRLGLGQEEPVLLVFGGSRGARSINQALLATLPALLPRCQVVHISGTLDWPEVEAFAQSLPQPLRPRYHAYPYLHDEMPLALAAADLGVARAGASTLGEFPALALPSILVPYPYSGQHQDNNAVYLADRGAAIKLTDAELKTRLASAILELLDDPATLRAMATAAQALSRPNAAATIAAQLIGLAHGG
jgi:UDP-N-acetylglucosamine--N-acetylmuramyl-(pentapeptide) pyrophosphoryl-undecaprenol N-acetylglucosamine transferase